MTVIVCGGRNYHDRDTVFHSLSIHHSYYTQITLLVHGDATGADSLAQEWADMEGVQTAKHPADWKKHGRSAGMIRNKEMLDCHNPDMVIAFPGGPGTEGMKKLAARRGIRVIECN